MTKPPFIRHFKFPTQQGMINLCCVVMDQSEFNEVCDAIVEKGSFDSQQAEKIKKIGHIPLVMRGTKTEFLFEKFNVEVDHLSLIVRGKGEEVFHRYMDAANPERN